VLYDEFAYLRRRLEGRVRHHASEESASEAAHALTGRRLKALSSDVYELNRLLIAQVQLATVGLYQEGKGVGVGPCPGAGTFTQARRACWSPTGNGR
jgi:hypothetical protein